MATAPHRSTNHAFQLGRLVTLAAPVEQLNAGTVVQVIGFRGLERLQVRPIGGLPVVAHHEQVRDTNLPAGSGKPLRRFRRKRQRRHH